MPKTAINQFDVTPGNNTDVDGIGVGAAMTVDNTNDAFQHLMALIAQQMGEVGALAADLASAATTDLSAARGWFCNITGTNTISSFGTVPSGKIFRLRMVNGLTLTYNAVSMILPNAGSFSASAGDIVTMLSLGSGNWRFVDYSPAGGGALPAGSIVDFGGTVAPGGWLLCNGQLVSRTGYPLLFAAIGTAYGAGDGTSTFGIPDFRGRAAIGNDTMGSSAAGRITTATINTPSVNGGTGGVQNYVLGLSNIPGHTHGITATTSGISANHTHTQQGTFSSGGRSAAHTHSPNQGGTFVSWNGGGTFLGTTWSGGQSLYSNTGTTAESADHSHNTTISGQTGLVSSDHTHTVTAISDTGQSLPIPPSALSLVQPSLICAKIIKT